MKSITIVLSLACAAAVVQLATVRRESSKPAPGPEAVAAVLDDFHDAASKADGARYFGHLAADAIFLGTDASERWSKTQFEDYAKPFFDEGRGWTYLVLPGRRFVTVADDGQTAWFDEALKNAQYGECRGTGVLVRKNDAWKIAQYNLTVPIPNSMLPEVAKKIMEQKKK